MRLKLGGEQETRRMWREIYVDEHISDWFRGTMISSSSIPRILRRIASNKCALVDMILSHRSGASDRSSIINWILHLGQTEDVLDILEYNSHAKSQRSSEHKYGVAPTSASRGMWERVLRQASTRHT